MNRATARGSGCSVGWRHTLYLHHLAPPAHLHGLSFPSRLVAAYHTSVKRHSVLAMKSLYVRAHVRVKCVCARARVRARARVLRMCARMCAKHRGSSISTACIRIIYSARASLTAPTVTGRSSGRFSARMTVYGPLFCANFSFSLSLSLSFFSFSIFPPLLSFSPTLQRVATTHVFCCSQTFPLEISVFQTARKTKQDRR